MPAPCRAADPRIVPGRAQQRLQPLSRRRGKAADDAGIKLLIVGAARGPDDAINAIGRRRLDQKLAASGLQKRGKLIRNRAYSCHLTAQPIFEPRRIGNARLAKARQSADFGTVSFGGPPRQARREARGSRDGELPRDLLDDRRIDLAGGSRKPSSVAEKHQQYGEAEPVLMMLGHDERQIRRRQWRSLRGHSLVGDFQFGRGGCRGGRSLRLFTKPAFCKECYRGGDEICGVSMVMASALGRRNVKSAPPTATDAHERGKDFLSDAEIAALLDTAKAGRHGVRDHLLIVAMFRHGLRVSEAIGLRRDEVDLDHARLWIRRLKNGLAVEHPIAGDELRAIKRYLATRADLLPCSSSRSASSRSHGSP